MENTEYWWLALANEVNREEKYVSCKFMHPHGYTEYFYWPTRDDRPYVPSSKTLLKVITPNTLSQSGQQYKVSINKVQQIVEKYLQKNPYCVCVCVLFF